MAYFRTLLTLFLMVTVSLPLWAARELVDDFNGPTMDFTKWSEYDPAYDISEYFVRISKDDDNLLLINVGDGIGPYREGYKRQDSRLWLRNPDLSALQATIAIVSVDDGGGKAAANIEGQYYNAVTDAPADQTGDVFATVSIGDRGSGLEAWWEIHVSTHTGFETWDETTGSIIAPGTLSLNTPYIARIEYDDSQTFTFTVDGTSSGAVLGPARMGAPFFTRQNLSSSTRCCGMNPSIRATFDDVQKGNPLVLLDDFSMDNLDRSIWSNHSGGIILASRIAPSFTGRLFMYVSDEDIPQDGRASSDLYLRERNPDRIEARVSIERDSILDPGLLGRVRLNGYVYNERRDGGAEALPYDGCDGDVWVQIQILMQNNILWATAFAGPELSTCDTERTLISETFTQPIVFGKNYLIWIERDGNNLKLGLDDEVYEHNITTPIYPPSPSAGNGFRRLSARIQGTPTSNPAGANGLLEVIVHDVYVEDIDGEPPVAVDDNITATEDVKFTSVTDLDANDTDVDGDKLKVISGTFTTVEGGKIVIKSNGSYTYKPAKNFHGADSYDYTVKEKKSRGRSDVGTLNITVDPVNDAPVANNDEIDATKDTLFISAVDLDANDDDVDGDPLTVEARTFETREGGSITLATDGSYTYTPVVGFIGKDTYKYKVTDGLLTDKGTLKITVTGDLNARVDSVIDQIDTLIDDPGTTSKQKNHLKDAKKDLKRARNLLNKGNIKKGMPKVSNGIKDMVKAEADGANVDVMIEQLLDGAKDDAQDAIDAAIAAAGNASKIADAQDLMTEAQEKRNEDKPDKAIKKYRDAWIKAIKAV